ncbi:MAG: hypothetical protein J6C85_05800 [Alphaproteobacteria bacterium]|nr:hypothetical protein [Alphaproteobacteria bacterium]
MESKSFWQKFGFCLAAVVIVGWVGVFLFLNSSSVAPPGTTAAKVTLGTVSDTPYQGFFFRAPFCSDVVLVNTKQQAGRYKSSQIKTSDMQTIGLECTVIYQVNSKKVPEIVKNVDVEKIDSVVLFPRLASALQETIGKNDILLLVTKQEMVREATKYILADLLSTDGYVDVKEVLFCNPKFSAQFEKAIEDKKKEEQLLEIAKIQTQKVEEEAKQLWILAEVELKALKQKKQVLTNPLIAKYEAVKILQKWKGDVPSTLMISGEGTAVPVVPVQGNVKP